MTLEEMYELKSEYGEEMAITPAHRCFDEDDYGNKYDISYKGIICGSELVDADFVREYIREQVEPLFREM